MKNTATIILFASGLILASCSRKGPDHVNSIPDEAIAVMSIHPMQIHTKGKLSTFESLKKHAKGEVWEQILDDPMSTGIMMNEYVYLFAMIEEEAPVMGFVAALKDAGKFESTLGRVSEDMLEKVTQKEGFKYIDAEDDGILAWNEEKVVILASPDNDEFENSYWVEKLDWMFAPVKEESVISLLDFKDFHGKMKDINLWLSAEDIFKIVKKLSKEDFGGLPVRLDNNYSHMYCDFANGEMNITAETNLSEEVRKNLDQVLVMNSSLNRELLGLTPGGDLLLGVSVSMDLDKVKKLAEKFGGIPELGKAGEKVENITGIPTEDFLNVFTGDFTLAINGLEENPRLPFEVFIGFGVNSKSIQDKLMDNVDDLVPVEEDGDFFMINAQGMEIYSGILHDTWVITNVKGYKDAVDKGKLSPSLLDSEFKEYANGSLGMYMNLDLEAYPKFAKDLLEQDSARKEWVDQISSPFDCFGLTMGKEETLMTLKTKNPGENSLYTIINTMDKLK